MGSRKTTKIKEGLGAHKKPCRKNFGQNGGGVAFPYWWKVAEASKIQKTTAKGGG